jgi:signal transduction histidine kinase
MRPWHVWTAYALCLAVAAAALVALTYQAVESDRSEARARREAALEENCRLALWRMDSTAATLVARESATADGVAPQPPVMARFRLAGIGPATIHAAAGREAAVRAALDVGRRTGFPTAQAPPSGAAPAAAAPADPAAGYQYARSNDELRRRQQVVEQIATQNSFQLQQQPLAALPPTALALIPGWLGAELVLARRTAEDAWEGCLLDWPSLRGDLLGSIADLLPGADLVPCGDAAEDARRLAALPLRLVPGAATTSSADAGWSPLRWALAAAWLAMAAAAFAAAALLAGVLALSERRAAFVSSVTHELRTPLTTFRLYANLLEEGMVPPAEVPVYHATLRTEAERLAHLVENVLAYARLERGAAAPQAAPVLVADLLPRIVERACERARQAGFAWQVTVAADARDMRVRAEPAAVEQVLFNLVDNACKYGRAEPPVIELAVARRGRGIALAVRDHGPGLPAREAARLFQPFRKSARDAAGTAPGVGLGLALARRLARQMGGELTAESPADGGARFVLWLRADTGTGPRI